MDDRQPTLRPTAHQTSNGHQAHTYTHIHTYRHTYLRHFRLGGHGAGDLVEHRHHVVHRQLRPAAEVHRIQPGGHGLKRWNGHKCSWLEIRVSMWTYIRMYVCMPDMPDATSQRTLQPSEKMARVSTVAVVVPSPAMSFVLEATCRTSAAPMFTKLCGMIGW